MSDLHTRLRDDLKAAMRDRDRDAVRVLRTVLAAIDNAGAQPHPEAPYSTVPASSTVAKAAHGLGAAEVDRRELDTHQVRGTVEAERDERLSAAHDLAARGAHDAATTLRAEAELLQRYLV